MGRVDSPPKTGRRGVAREGVPLRGLQVGESPAGRTGPVGHRRLPLWGFDSKKKTRLSCHSGRARGTRRWDLISLMTPDLGLEALEA